MGDKDSCSAGCGMTRWIALPVRVALGGVFVFAAFNKLFITNGPALFNKSIHAFKLDEYGMTEGMMTLSTHLVPWVELVAGLALILGFWLRAAATITGAMLVVFIAMYASVLLRDLNVECGCFGKLSPFCPKTVGSCHILQNATMLLMAGLLAWWGRSAISVDGMLAGKAKAPADAA